MVRSTLNNLVSGNIPIELIDNKSKTCGDPEGGTTFGCNIPGSKTIYINKTANDAVYENFIETLCHETNHALNQTVVTANVLDKFYNEYRAHIVGKLGRGEIFTAAAAKELINKLGRVKTETPKAYMDFNDFYQNKKFPEFKTGIDQAYKDAEKGTIIDAVEMKKRLIAVPIFKTPYIVGTNNTDNR